MKLMKSKRGEVMSTLQAFIMGLAGVTIVLVVVLIILSQIQSATETAPSCYNASYSYNSATDFCDNLTVGVTSQSPSHSLTWNATNTIVSKVAGIPTWIGIVIVVSLAFVVLGFFMFQGEGGMGRFKIQ